jgi:hypothetical protein
MSLEDSYDDYIAVMPDGHTRYFRNSLRKSTINEIQIIFLQIQLYERNNYFYKNYINYRNKIDELLIVMKEELIYRNVIQKENKSGLSIKAQEFIPASFSVNTNSPLRSILRN